MDQPPETAEQGADRHHADSHHGIAQAGSQTLHLFRDRLQAAIVGGGGELGQSRLGDDEFADPIHQLVEPLGRDTQRGGGLPARFLVLLDLNHLGRRGIACFRHRSDGSLHHGIQSLDRQLHAVGQKHEDVFNSGAWTIRDEQDLPAEVADLRVDRLQRRDRVGESSHLAGAELAQLIQKQQRIGAEHECILRQTEAYPPGLTGASGGCG